MTGPEKAVPLHPTPNRHPIAGLLLQAGCAAGRRVPSDSPKLTIGSSCGDAKSKPSESRSTILIFNSLIGRRPFQDFLI